MALTEELLRAGELSEAVAGEARAEPFLAQLRRRELRQVLDVLQRHGYERGSKVLEIGGGTGWQARDLAEAGYDVQSVDVEARPGVFPVAPYDGHRLPCADASCDVIFSSNALEHIPHIEAFQAELRRVLKRSGICVHLMPTPIWRLASTLAHYPHLVRAALAKLMGEKKSEEVRAARAARTGRQWIWHALVPPRHGEFGNVISETWHFSARRWTRLFARHGWRLVEQRSNGLFYTGYNLFGARLPFGARKLLAGVLGGSCRLYVLTK